MPTRAPRQPDEAAGADAPIRPRAAGGMRRQVRDNSLTIVLLLAFCLSLAGMALAGLLDAKVWTAFAFCLPGIVLGTWLGLRLYAYVDDRQFRGIVLWLVLASGVVLTV